MRLVTALLVKNEADRYLGRVLRRCHEFSDAVLVLDDRSTDKTPKVAKLMGCQVRERSVLKGNAWGNEAPARQELWHWAAEEAGQGWVLFCDADMLLQGNPRDLAWSTELNAWAFILYDVWNEEETAFRYDGHWRAHFHPRPWMVRPAGMEFQPAWERQGIHVGHLPSNAPLVTGVAPPETYYWLHMQYASPQSRQQKYAAYREVAQLMTSFEREHAESILT